MLFSLLLIGLVRRHFLSGTLECKSLLLDEVVNGGYLLYVLFGETALSLVFLLGRRLLNSVSQYLISELETSNISATSEVV